MKILFAASECHPLVKTGGLGDVAGSLPPALRNLHLDVRVVIPAYRDVLRKVSDFTTAAELSLPGAGAVVRVLQGTLADSEVPIYLVDSPVHYDRPGGPYGGPDGRDWPDNAARFALFGRAITAMGLGRAGLDWRPDLVHCNDWQSALAPALLAREPDRPATVFTIHNLAYQGLFERSSFDALGLPGNLWQMNAMEFYGRFSFIKGGLVFADRLTTVSPTYAREICTPEFGYGLENLLLSRATELVGILNGADYSVWSPAHDPYLDHHYNARALRGKSATKAALLSRLGFRETSEVPLVGHVGRLVEQKGVDLLVDALPDLLRLDAQFVVLGTGERRLEQALRAAAGRSGARLQVQIGYSEELAHWIEAGADIFLMPSRFEPCGLNQIYSQHYGTVPVVRRTGGLADTVVDATDENLLEGTATGVMFDAPTSAALAASLRRALALYHEPRTWRSLMQAGMRQDFSWKRSATQYVALYRQLVS